MATFVLVHGGWCGGWFWQDVRPLLREAGHEVHSPTLTGLGERVHLAGPAVGLATHVQDIVNVLRYELLGGVILVGHSYGGMVVTGVADRVPERLAHLAYVDGFVPRDGQSVFDLIPPEMIAWLEEEARTGGDGWRVPPFAVPELAEFSQGRDDPHPLATLREPLRLANPAAEAIPRTFIHCTGKPADDPQRPVFEPLAARARSEPGWRYRELPTVHDAPATMPRELADLLLELA